MLFQAAAPTSFTPRPDLQSFTLRKYHLELLYCKTGSTLSCRYCLDGVIKENAISQVVLTNSRSSCR